MLEVLNPEQSKLFLETYKSQLRHLLSSVNNRCEILKTLTSKQRKIFLEICNKNNHAEKRSGDYTATSSTNKIAKINEQFGLFKNKSSSQELSQKTGNRFLDPAGKAAKIPRSPP